MDEYYKEQQELQAFDKHYYYNKNHFLKRTFQLVLSVSIFSLILCYSSGFSFFPHSFNVYFSTFLFSFFTHTFERKYMFLICNGILAFLAKCSVSCSTSSSSASVYAAAELSASGLSEMKIEEVPVATVDSLENVVEEEQEQVKDSTFGEEKGRESGVFVEEEDYNESVVTQGEDIAEEAVNELSTEELNKKIEEFLKKMKEEIRIEAQQQSITM